ncbi:MAG: 50S ribosomal protein L15 [Candidatus Gracilibacteria bacterium]|nr:50S ribosomal protein L15 [Candidatus Gracilibacteria bacterium]
MVSLNTISSTEGSTQKRKRLGRGNASGHGTYCGRGVKGQGSRTGIGKFNAAFEGGQTPLFRRLPKSRGFTKWNQVEFNVVNLSDLAELAALKITTVDAVVLAEHGYIRKNGNPLKVLANGKLDIAVTITANKASKEALEQIQKAGGKVELI